MSSAGDNQITPAESSTRNDKAMPIAIVRSGSLNICIIGEIGAEGVTRSLANKGHQLMFMSERPPSPAQLPHHRNKLLNFHPHVIIFATLASTFREAVTLFPAATYENVLVMSYLHVMTQFQSFLFDYLPKFSDNLLTGPVLGSSGEKKMYTDFFTLGPSSGNGTMYQRATAILTLFYHVDCHDHLKRDEDFEGGTVQSAIFPTIVERALNQSESFEILVRQRFTSAGFALADRQWQIPGDALYTMFRYDPDNKPSITRLLLAIEKMKTVMESAQEKLRLIKAEKRARENASEEADNADPALDPNN